MTEIVTEKLYLWNCWPYRGSYILCKLPFSSLRISFSDMAGAGFIQRFSKLFGILSSDEVSFLRDSTYDFSEFQSPTPSPIFNCLCALVAKWQLRISVLQGLLSSVCSNVLNWEAPCFCRKAPKKAPHDFFSKSATILLESATIWLFSSEHEVKKCPSWWFLFHFYVTIPSQGQIY